MSGVHILQIPGLEYERFFSREGVDPFDEVEWDLRVGGDRL